MSWNQLPSRWGGKSRSRPEFRPTIDGLEARSLMSGATLHASATQTSQAQLPTRTGQAQTLSGRITNEANGKALRGVEVQLLNAAGIVVETTHTNARGRYAFRVRGEGAHVLREVTPRGYLQASPVFTNVAPTGAYAPGRGTKDWNYRTGNNDPNLGPVGPNSWGTIAPAGNLPFESPVNLTGPTIDLGRVLSVNYKNTVPKDIINNGAQIQVRMASTAPDTISLGGQTYALSQFHFHDTAESQVNGVTYPMEEHFVNVSASGGATVLAVFFQLGAHNDALDPILDAASASLTRPNTDTTITSPIDLAALLPADKSGWYYQGSLTTPPLAQVLNWLVFATPITLDYQQLVKYEAVASASEILGNDRPIQFTDGRQFNEVDYDLDLQGTSMTNLDFTLTRKPATGQETSLGSSRRRPQPSLAIDTTTLAALTDRSAKSRA